MGAFVLTSENYYSQEANKEYLSVSQYKQFAGTYGRRGCEFTALEELNGRWQQKKNSGMMIGSYVDSYVEGTLDEFKKRNRMESGLYCSKKRTAGTGSHAL